MNEHMKRWQAETTTKAINQIKPSTQFVFERFFKQKKGVLGNQVIIPIKKGSGVVLESVSPEAEHLIHDKGEVYEVSTALPHFPLESPILASELNQIKAIEGGRNQLESLSQKIGELLADHRRSFDATLEYMAAGAFFGRVSDGKGKVLFEFRPTRPAVAFNNSNALIDALSQIDDALVAELGMNPGVIALASRDFLNHVAAKAKSENLFRDGVARWREENHMRILELYGTSFFPYTASYNNNEGEAQPFIASNQAMFVPNLPSIFCCFYGRADHMQAVNRAPTLYFSTTEALPKGRGHAVISECKPLPVCLHPNAVIQASWS